MSDPIARVACVCGRSVLYVAGFAVAMEGDKCRDSNIPYELTDPIPEEELATATIGGQPAKNLPIDVVRIFRGERWTPAMLEYVANKINEAVLVLTTPEQ